MSFFACGRTSSTVDALATKPQPEARRIVVPSLPGERLNIDEATHLVREDIFRRKPGMNPSMQFPLNELTSAEIWDRLHAQVFVVSEGILVCQAFIIHNKKVESLCGGFGGFGLMSMCVVDPSGKGRPLLLFSHSFGSGIHRSMVGAWAAGTKISVTKIAVRDCDLFLAKIDDRQVQVTCGVFNPGNRTLNNPGEFGTIHLDAEATNPHIEITLREGLPADLRKRTSH